MARIKHDNWQRYVVFPKDARERAYRYSAAARELQPAFEGQIGETWRGVGCAQTSTAPCPEILSGWFMWALRDATDAAGHYRSADEARLFYFRLAAEINSACNENPSECLPYRQTLIPPWRNNYLMDTLHASLNVFKSLITISDTQPNIGASMGSTEQIASVVRITNGSIAPMENNASDGFRNELNAASSRNNLRLETAKKLATAESAISTFGIPTSIVIYLFWLLLAVKRRGLDVGLVITSALVAAVATRVVLLGFLDATSIPSNNLLYLTPVLPLALALIPAAAFGFIIFAKRDKIIVLQAKG